MKKNTLFPFTIAWVAMTVTPLLAAPIHEAAEKGDVESIKRILDVGVNIQEKEPRWQASPLQIAAGNGKIEAVKLLLDRGADINARDGNGGTALMSSAMNGYTETVKLLLDRGADINAVDTKHGNTALKHAVMGKHAETVALLKARGAKDSENIAVALQEASDSRVGAISPTRNAETAKSSSRPPLFDAIAANDIEAVTELLKKGAKVNAQDGYGKTPLIAAVQNRQLGKDVIKLLLDHGADVNAQAPGDSALLAALLRTTDGLEVLKMLLAKGVDVNAKAKDKLGRSFLVDPLLTGIQSQDPNYDQLYFEKLLLLLGNGADPYSATNVLSLPVGIEDFTEALIVGKNKWLPGYLATATPEQKVDLLTAVEKQISKAKIRVGKLNEAGRSSLTQGNKSSASQSRESALQVRAYLDVLNEIKTILEGS